MSKEVIVHIGQAKTGTTAIQMSLQENRDLLSSNGILYPIAQKIAHNHHCLIPMIRGATKVAPHAAIRFGGGDIEKYSEEEFKSIREQVSQGEYTKVILSSELLYFTIRGDEGTRFKEAINSLGDRHRFFAYLRSPVSAYVSLAQQRLKARGCKLALPTKTGYLDPIVSYERVFGECLELRVFERKRLYQGDVVEDFRAWVGIDEIRDFLSVQEVNATLSAEAMEVLRELGEEYAYNCEESNLRQRRLVQIVSMLDAKIEGGTKPVLSDEVAAYITAINTDLPSLRDEYGIEFSDIDYSRIGDSTIKDLPNFSKVSDFSKLDEGRAEEMAQRTRKLLKSGVKSRLIFFGRKLLSWRSRNV